MAETISRATKQSTNIDSFVRMNGTRLKVFQYVDGTSVIVHSDRAVLSLFSLFERYERTSLFPFVWSKKREWMARSSVIQPVSQGGLGIVDIAKKILSLRAVEFVVFSVTHHIFYFFGSGVFLCFVAWWSWS